MDKFLSYFDFINLNGLRGLVIGGFDLGSRGLIALLFLVAVLLWGFSLGRTRAFLSILSIYIAFTINNLFPYFDIINERVAGLFQVADYWVRAGLFLSVYILIFAVLNYSFVKKRFTAAEFSVSGVILISLLQVGLMMGVIMSLIPDDVGANILGELYKYFGSDKYLFIWVLLPILALLFLKKRD